jgi:UDP-N-acetyl-2-amino-2-deoxyglucuronate dehydrogenase
MSGFIELKDANVSWYLAIDIDDLPQEAKEKGKTTFRSITIDGEEFEFSEGFTDLHTRMYEVILEGNGYGLSDVRSSIELTYNLRMSPVSKLTPELHSFMLKE